MRQLCHKLSWGQDGLEGRTGLGKQILLTGQVLNVLRYRCIRGERRMTTIKSVRATEEEKYGYHGCSAVIIFRIAVDYIYSAQTAQGVRFRRARFINENYTAERWYITDKKGATCLDSDAFLTTLSFFSDLILHYIMGSLF